MKTILKITAGILLAACVLIVGCSVLLSAGVNEAVQEVQKDSDRTAITFKQYRSVNSRDSRDDVVQSFGAPSSASEVGLKDLSSECVYYNRKGKFASIFQFCFDGNGKYQSKASI